MARNSEPIRHWEILQTLDGSEAAAGPPERIEIEFDACVAGHILARDWHPTQRLRTDVDGSVRLTLDVRPDQTIRSWILSFGPLARVVSPTALAEQIIEDLDATRRKYAPRIDFELPIVLLEELDAQDALPFGF
jgi:predicted DNA-binding transcriptional regulator YafY